MTLFTTNYYVQQVFSLDEQTKGVPGNNILDILLLIVKPLLSHGILKSAFVLQHSFWIPEWNNILKALGF